MERQEMLKWKKAAWQKLMGAIAMLLVASIMMSATSYAWFVLSTAPEVTDLTTTAGANGALEIALQSNKAGGNGRADILSGVGQSIASKDAQTANTYWGNVVDLSKGYGLEHITLYPARLNLTNDSQVNMQNMLSIPTFGTDGRVTSLKNAEKTYYKDRKFEQGQSHWGVNVMGATSDQAGVEETITLTYNRDFVLNEARTKVAEYRTSLREQMTKTIEDNSLGIMGTLLSVTEFEPKIDVDVDALMKSYLKTMTEIVNDAKMAVRWALMASAAADKETFPDNDSKKLGELYASCNDMNLTGEKSVAFYAGEYGYDEIKTVAEALARAEQSVLNANKVSAAEAIGELIDYKKTYVHGSKGSENVESIIMNGANTGIFYDFPNMEETDHEPVLSDSIYMVKSERSLFSTMADIIGDYSGAMTIWYVTERDPEGMEDDTYSWSDKEVSSDNSGSIPATYSIVATQGETWTDWNQEQNIGLLGEIFNHINGMTAPGTIRVELKRSDLSAYGYSVDLALQCSKNTNLQLQQEGIVRVSSDGSGTEDTAADTMGGGSTMVFDLAGDLTEAQVRKLMRGIYVVLLNTDSGEIYKIAAVDPDQLTVDRHQYPNRATGTLTLYEPVIQNDVLSLGDKATSITAMTADTQLNLTALVFLNGDQVDASMFSGTQALSLTGTLNLQFASSETLTAMEYTDYAPEKTTDNP